MTCQDVKALHGLGTEAFTPSLFAAFLRHYEACPACRQELDGVMAALPADVREAVRQAALDRLPGILHHLGHDPEAT